MPPPTSRRSTPSACPLHEAIPGRSSDRPALPPCSESDPAAADYPSGYVWISWCRLQCRWIRPAATATIRRLLPVRSVRSAPRGIYAHHIQRYISGSWTDVCLVKIPKLWLPATGATASRPRIWLPTAGPGLWRVPAGSSDHNPRSETPQTKSTISHQPRDIIPRRRPLITSGDRVSMPMTFSMYEGLRY